MIAANGLIQEALRNPWIAGHGATDHDLLPEIRAYMAKARLRRGIEMVKLANRIEALKMQEDEEEHEQDESEIPANATEAAGNALASGQPLEGGLDVPPQSGEAPKKRLQKLAKSAIFREVVLAKVRELKAEEEAEKVRQTKTNKSHE